MADPSGLALGLPGLFMSCIQCFELVQFGRHFERDFGAASARLKAANIHLIRWGVAAGIDSEPMRPSAQKQLSNYRADDLAVAEELLEEIRRTFTSAQETASTFARRQKRSQVQGEEGTTQVLDEETALKRAETGFRTLNLALCKVKGNYGVAKIARSKTFDKVRWALYHRNNFNHLVMTVSGLIQELEALFPIVQPSEGTLCRRDAVNLDAQAVNLLLTLIGDDDPIMKQSLELERSARGLCFDGVVAEGNSRARLGNAFAAGESQVSGNNHVYRNMTLRGDCIIHAGNAYGFADPLSSRNQ